MLTRMMDPLEVFSQRASSYPEPLLNASTIASSGVLTMKYIPCSLMSFVAFPYQIKL